MSEADDFRESDDEDEDLGKVENLPSVAVADPEEYSQSRRLKAIHDARKNVLDTRDNILEAQFRNGFSDQLARRYFRQAVENYLLEVEPLLTSEDVDCASKYWEKRELGTFTIHPPAELTQRPDDPHTHIVNSTGLPEPETVSVTGLQTLIDTEWPHTESFEVKVNAKHEGVRTLRRTVSTEPSMDILLSAFRATNEFLRDVEIDATLDTSEEEFHGDYSDILDDHEEDPRDHVDNSEGESQ